MKRKPTFSIFSMVLFVCLAGSPLSSSAGGSDYYVVIDGEQKGPMATEQLENLKQDGMLTSDTLVWKDGMAEWGKAGEQEDLEKLFAAAAPPPAPPPTPSTPAPPAPAGEAAQMPAPSAEEQEVSAPTHMFPLASEVAGSKISEQKEKYLDERGWSEGATAKGSYIGWGEAKITVDPESIDWGQKRIMAYDRAYSDALAGFIRFKRRQQTTATVRKFFDQDYQPSESDPESQLEVIGEKVMELAEAKLDEALREAGKDPSGKRLSEKQTLMQDSISREINTSAFGAISGTRVLFQFEDLTDVGVLIVNSQEYQEIANRISAGQVVATVSAHDPVAYIKQQIREIAPDDKQFIPMTGVRIMTDKDGNRVLVGFGQWSAAVSRADSQLKIGGKVKAAKELAFDRADGAITDFVKATTALDQKSKMASDDRITKLKFDGGMDREDESKKVGALINSFVETHGSSDLSGVAKIKDWAVNHPTTGHLLIGRIMMWSPTLSTLAKMEPTDDVTPPGPEPEPIVNEVLKSPDFDKDSDF